MDGRTEQAPVAAGSRTRNPNHPAQKDDNMIDWFFTTLKTYPEIAIFLTLALGYYFGKFTFKGIGLGAVTATLLASDEFYGHS